MADEALVISRIVGSSEDKVQIVPSVTAHDFVSDADRPTVTSGGNTQTFYKVCDRVFIRDETTKAVSDDSGLAYTDAQSFNANYSENIVLSAFNRYLVDLGLSDADKNTTYADADMQKLLSALLAGDMEHVLYQADQVSTALPGWDTTVRDIVKQASQDFIDKNNDTIKTISVTAGGTCSNPDGDYVICHIDGDNPQTSGNGEGARFVVTVSSGAVSAVTSIDARGRGYAATDTITISSIAGTALDVDAVLTVDSVGF